MLLCGARAFSLNPSLDISQYAHYTWKNSDGFAKGTIGSIAQTQDGYLWLGTGFGLLRFDGVRAVPWATPAGEQLPSDDIRGLLVTRDGSLWIGTSRGLASWHGGRLTRYEQLSGYIVGGLLEDTDGVVWAGGRAIPAGKLCAIRSGTVKCYGEDGRFGNGVFTLLKHGGGLWVGAANGLWLWKPESSRLFPLPDYANQFIEGEHGSFWIATNRGMYQFVNGEIKEKPVGAGRQFPIYRLLRDRDGGFWIAAREVGLIHTSGGRVDVYGPADGLTSDRVSSLFEDREGNIWAGTNEGLDRFHEFAVSTISLKQGLKGSLAGAILADRDGGVWLGTDSALGRWKNGEITVYRNSKSPRSTFTLSPLDPWRVREIVDDGLPADTPESLAQGRRGRVWVSTRRGLAYYEDGRFVRVLSVPSFIVHSIEEDREGGLWINDQEMGLLQWDGSRLAKRISWASLAVGDVAISFVVDSRQGGLWLGLLRGGLVYFKDGAVRASYTSAAGLGSGRVNDLRMDREGVLWAATDGGVSRFQDGHIVTLSRQSGLPCDSAQWTMEDDSGALWMTMACGLVSISRQELDAWRAKPKHTVQARVFDGSDGFRGAAVAGGFSPRVARLEDGRLFFSNAGGAGVIDPRHIPINQLPPPVSIEQIAANGKASPVVPGAAPLRLPPLVRQLQIDYTALSFVAPEKNRFRYKLEGHDAEWTDAGARRQAFYNDLGPRSYRFRVQACNNNGVWNEAGAFLDFSVAPATYQTNWFLAACVAASLAFLFGLYRLRVAQVARQFNLRLEERVNERTRIARDLHDTLLQSFQGVLLKFHAVTYLIPNRPGEAQKTLEAAIEEARQAIAEGRDAVQGLRSSTVITEDIARAITTFGEGLAAQQNTGQEADFQVHVEGVARSLAPVVRDEIYRIAGEGLRNAFRHSSARRIEVEIHYDRRELRLRIRDNGKGIDPKVLSAGGREGHHGLPGMQERARLVSGKLSVWSELDSGTEIELTIPAAIAYAKASATSQAGQGT